ncbi:helix-turn-helix domain-containing protein [Maricaulis sp.]|uniref:helix-turn-helix domain-containing protein n=3 Tax=Maricaulis sp. TaxID=1486257 RepID=UPI00329A5373
MSRLSVIPVAALDDVAEKRISATDLRVLCGLGACTNKWGWANDTKQDRIAKKAKLTRETVNRSLNRLESMGWVEVYESRDPMAKLKGLLCYRVILDPPFGPCGERLESPTYKRRRAVLTLEQERQARAGEGEAEDVPDADVDAALDTGEAANPAGHEVAEPADAVADGRAGPPGPDQTADAPAVQGPDATPCDRRVTGGGVTGGSQGGCDHCDHRGCDHCDHSRVDSFIDKSSMSTSARRMTRGERVAGVWFDPDVELMPALVEARVRDAVTAHLVEGLGQARAIAALSPVDVRAYRHHGSERWAVVCPDRAGWEAFRQHLAGLGSALTDRTGTRVQVMTEARWARLTAEITMPYTPPDGEAGRLFDMALECGRTETDLAPCVEDGFVVVPDPEHGFAVQSTGMNCREVGRVFIGAIKALGWNTTVRPQPPAERLKPKEVAHGQA